MRAIVYTQYGSPEVLQQQQWVKPLPAKGEVLVRVKASSVSAAAVMIRKGRHPDSKLFTFLIRLMFGIVKPRRPILGYEFSGVVEAVGNAVTHFRPGDEVYGTTTGLANGAYADYVCIPQQWKEGVITTKPANLSFEEAAALPVGAMTALQFLQKARLKAGEHVLIYGASGSVGSYAVQIAKSMGARITAVCSDANREWVMSLGADEVLAYDRKEMESVNMQFDVIFDAAAKLDPQIKKAFLKKKGRFCTVKTYADEKLDYLFLLHKLIDQDKLKPVIDRTYAFEEIQEAHHYVDQGHKKGNVVIRHY